MFPHKVRSGVQILVDPQAAAAGLKGGKWQRAQDWTAKGPCLPWRTVARQCPPVT